MFAHSGWAAKKNGSEILKYGSRFRANLLILSKITVPLRPDLNPICKFWQDATRSFALVHCWNDALSSSDSDAKKLSEAFGTANWVWRD
jgi:transposase